MLYSMHYKLSILLLLISKLNLSLYKLLNLSFSNNKLIINLFICFICISISL